VGYAENFSIVEALMPMFQLHGPGSDKGGDNPEAGPPPDIAIIKAVVTSNGKSIQQAVSLLEVRRG
jgi:hypothetical protein